MREKLYEVEYLLGEFPNSKELSKMRRKLINCIKEVSYEYL